MVLLNEQSAASGGQNRAKAVFLTAVIAVLIATLWPFDAFSRNGVTWLDKNGGLEFRNSGLVISKEYLKPAETNEAYSLELLVQPANGKTGTILGFYDEARPTQLMIGQSGDRIIVTRNTTIQSDRTRPTEFDVNDIFRPGTLAFVTVTSGPHGTSVYLDGKLMGSRSILKLSRSDFSGQIVLGTSPTICEPWSGELRGLAIYAKELTTQEAFRHYQEWTSGPHEANGAIAYYRFAEAAGREIRSDVTSGPPLEIPTRFEVPYKPFLRSARKEFKADWRYARDAVVNIVGFIPLGLIACMYFSWTSSKRKAILAATIACGLLSLAIEVMQYYIPRRFSGSTDILTNTLGAAIGAALMQSGAVRRLLREMKFIPQ